MIFERDLIFIASAFSAAVMSLTGSIHVQRRPTNLTEENFSSFSAGSGTPRAERIFFASSACSSHARNTGSANCRMNVCCSVSHAARSLSSPCRIDEKFTLVRSLARLL